MAKIIPSIEKIMQFSVKPEEGELHLLSFLEKELDNSFEVYFNPYMNGDRPDIVIMKKGQGVLIIEVKDYKLENYELDERKNWKVKNRTREYNIKSPISQVLKYKNNLFELHIENLLELKIKDFRNFNIVSCAVYFHNATKDQITDFIVKPFEHDRKYLDFLKYNIDLLGKDSLNEFDFKEILKNRHLISERPSYFFTDIIYNSFQRFLKPPIHLKEQGKEFYFSEEQQKIIYDNSSIQSKLIKGVVGSGKTTVLASRAVQAYKKSKGKILILTYNITLKNFIRDKLSLVREEFPWDSFVILNYHFFITTELNNLGVPITVPSGFSEFSEEDKKKYFEDKYYSNKSLFEDNKDKIRPYDVILIDEIQDYKRTWMEIIKEYYLSSNGEYILFGDVKQNIYNNKIENKDLVTNIGRNGSVRFLKRCYRSDYKIKDLAIEYQKEIFQDRYEIDDFNNSQNLEIQFERNQQGEIKYIYLQETNTIRSLYTIIHENAINKGIPPNDITVLSQTIKLLRDFDSFYRYSSNERTNTMFETNEMIYRMGLNFLKSNDLPEWLNEALILINRQNDRKKIAAFNQLSILFTLLDLNETHEHLFDNKLEFYCNKFRTSKKDFLEFVAQNNDGFTSFKKEFGPKRISKDLNLIRTNKKIHFFFNSGTLKLSTVHSFKGWESELLFLIIEPKYHSNSEFEQSFDEIIYTGLTRSRSNLIILNYGNEDYHEKLKEIVERVK
jgi:hypothetical protein